mmetsp:Transcript_27533/g.80379  ORF Transcript_27533/g.80379 Transcript_27533/m.80379 type:complete len:228 (-) Transcript_27533:531-1214(-)
MSRRCPSRGQLLHPRPHDPSRSTPSNPNAHSSRPCTRKTSTGRSRHASGESWMKRGARWSRSSRAAVPPAAASPVVAPGGSPPRAMGSSPMAGASTAQPVLLPGVAVDVEEGARQMRSSSMSGTRPSAPTSSLSQRQNWLASDWKPPWRRRTGRRRTAFTNSAGSPSSIPPPIVAAKWTRHPAASQAASSEPPPRSFRLPRVVPWGAARPVPRALPARDAGAPPAPT